MNPDDFVRPTAKEATQALALFNFPPTYLVDTPPRSPDREETERLGYLNINVNNIDMRAFCQLSFSPDNSIRGDEDDEDQNVEEPEDDRLDEVADSPPPSESSYTSSSERSVSSATTESSWSGSSVLRTDSEGDLEA